VWLRIKAIDPYLSGFGVRSHTVEMIFQWSRSFGYWSRVVFGANPQLAGSRPLTASLVASPSMRYSVPYKWSRCVILWRINIKKHGNDSAKFTRSARRTVYLYARPKVEPSRDYQISITAEPIELIINSIDRAYPNYIKKICLFLLYVLYEKKLL